MSYRAASSIASHLVRGFFEDAGYGPSRFDKDSGDVVKVFVDFANGASMSNVRIALDAWSTVSGLRFQLNGTRADYDLHLTDRAQGAYSFFRADEHGDRVSSVVNVGRDWLNAYGTDTVSYYTQTWIHEIGHALGLGHTGDYNGTASWGDQKFALDSWQMSVMSYFAPYENPNVTADYAFVLTPMPADILAIHRLFGAPDTSDGRDVYGFDGTAEGIYARFGNMLDRGATDQPVMLTIYDSAGVDLLNLSQDAEDQRINLNPGRFSDVMGWVGTLGIAYGTFIENARAGRGDDVVIGNKLGNRLLGGVGEDTLIGNAGDDRLSGQLGADVLKAGTGSDTLIGADGGDRLVCGNGRDRAIGGAGNDFLNGSWGADQLLGGLGMDSLRGGRGADQMNGGNGRDVLRGCAGSDLMSGGADADRFVFRSGDQPTASDIDRIMDFTTGEDILDLRGLGLDRLRVGAGPLPEGLLRANDRADGLHLRADLDGDGRSDLNIVLLDTHKLLADDVLL